MPTQKKRLDFFTTDEGNQFVLSLLKMVGDGTYNTESTYSANSDLYPDNLIPFVEKHKNYINAHPSTDPQTYISNLRLMTRKR